MLEKISQIVLLKDFYGPLLTDKQQQIMDLHYENDWSLSEIAQSLNTSRQAVYDIVKKAETQLEEYEKKLGLVKKFQLARCHLDELTNLWEQSANRTNTQRAMFLLQEIAGLL
jgi:uncharacterized protein